MLDTACNAKGYIVSYHEVKATNTNTDAVGKELWHQGDPSQEAEVGTRTWEVCPGV